ncbi:AMP-binding protein [Streptomyces sp. NPDC005529]|uniref:AMP-binding protein n=1 Tax=unclassified Streptomyces TaxID=2593676 RepID=UPI0033B93A68
MQYNVPDLLFQAARKAPWSLAVVENDQAITYYELAEMARRCAGFLAERTRPGDRVALVLPPHTRGLALYFGAHMAGLVPVVIDERLSAPRIGSIIDHTQAVVVVTSRWRSSLIRSCSLAGRSFVAAETAIGSPLKTTPRVIGHDLAALVYSSDTEGPLKGVMLSHDNLLAGAFATSDCLRLTERDRVLTLPSWSCHDGLNQVLATIAAAASVVVGPSASVPDICKVLKEARVTGLALIPGLWPTLTSVRSPFQREPYPRLRFITQSGGDVPRAALRALRAKHPEVEVFALYGHPETLYTTCLPYPLINTKPGSIGKPVPGSDVMVVDERGRPCPAGIKGQLVHRGSTIAQGYWRDPESTAAVFRHQPVGGVQGLTETVVYSGEYGYADADGVLHHTNGMTCPAQAQQRSHAAGAGQSR